MESRRGGWCLWVSVLLLGVRAFEWSLVDLLTPFLFPVLQLGVWLIFLVCWLWALSAAIVNRRLGYHAAVPLIPLILVSIAVWVTPFTNVWLDVNYRWYRADRQRIVRQVQEGRLIPGRARLVALGQREPYVSMGGNDIIVEEHDGRRYVFFFTFRGILDHYSGFLFVPEGGSPSVFSDLGEAESTQLQQLDAQWYFAAHW